jgi:hypothetical protein
MQPKAENRHGASVAIVGRVLDELIVGCEVGEAE